MVQVLSNQVQTAQVSILIVAPCWLEACLCWRWTCYACIIPMLDERFAVVGFKAQVGL